MKWIFLSVITALFAITNINAQDPQTTLEEIQTQIAEKVALAKEAENKATKTEELAKTAEEKAHEAALKIGTSKTISEEVQFTADAQKTKEKALAAREAATKAKEELENAKEEVLQLQQKEEIEHQYLELIATAKNNFELKEYDKAIENYSKALKLKPENALYINSIIDEINERISEPALLYVYRKRDSRINLPIILSTNQYDILLDNVVVCRSKNNWKTPTPVKISTFGTKTLSAEIDEKAEIQIKIEPGGIYYLRSGVKSKKIKVEPEIIINILTGKPVKSNDTKTEYTPILELISSELGASEYNAIVVK